jgi:hypothetical protein
VTCVLLDPSQFGCQIDVSSAVPLNWSSNVAGGCALPPPFDGGEAPTGRLMIAMNASDTTLSKTTNFRM